MSRLTIELKSGVFVGNFGRRVREKLWKKVSEDWKANALMIYTTNTEQGFAALSHGDTTREIVEYEGMILTAFEHKRADQLALVANDAFRSGYGPDPSIQVESQERKSLEIVETPPEYHFDEETGQGKLI